ncbi:hypothetical protein HDU97_007633 [Phlyctochytrium planicorne]|nr:hypothetical protein HDU97_007633 [Phlyctochytrium planicorne]
MVHLIVLHNGLWGNHKHLNFLASQLQEAHDRSETKALLPIEILNCALNEGFGTYHGIDGCGARVADAVAKRIEEGSWDDGGDENGNAAAAAGGRRKERKKRITHVSFVGYSLGGLILRYSIGVLYAQGWFRPHPSTSASSSSDSSPTYLPKAFRSNAVLPVHYATFATPHLGAKRSSDAKSLDRLINAMGAVVTGYSGWQVFLKDGKALARAEAAASSDGRREEPVAADSETREGTLLEVDVEEELFKLRTLYANVQNDPLVSHESASLLLTSPFDTSIPIESRFVKLERYPSLVIPGTSAPSSIRDDVSTTESNVTSNNNNPALLPKDDAERKETEAKPPPQPLTISRVLNTIAFPVFLLIGLSAVSGFFLAYQAQVFSRTVTRVWRSSRRTINGPAADSWIDSSTGSPTTSPANLPRSRDIYHRMQWWLPGWISSELSALDRTSRGLTIRGEEWTEGDTRSFIAWCLQGLEWKRFHVRSEFRRAHATMVKREEKFTGNEDVVGHFVDGFFQDVL